jgi:invasion protein IalB
MTKRGRRGFGAVFLSFAVAAATAMNVFVLHARAQAPVAGEKAAVPAPAPPEKDATPARPAEANWTTRCGGVARNGAVECSMDQTMIKTDTRQVVAMFRVRIPAETRAPLTFIQLPLGVYLPAGVELQIDQDKAIELPLQMCDAGGCYAGGSLSPDLAARLQGGKTLHLAFQNVAREKIDVAMPLSGFSAAYAAIK